jgi:hypothetical protein
LHDRAHRAGRRMAHPLHELLIDMDGGVRSFDHGRRERDENRRYGRHTCEATTHECAGSQTRVQARLTRFSSGISLVTISARRWKAFSVLLCHVTGSQRNKINTTARLAVSLLDIRQCGLTVASTASNNRSKSRSPRWSGVSVLSVASTSTILPIASRMRS